MSNGPCDVEVNDSTGAKGLSGIEAVKWLKKYVSKNPRLTVHRWEASAEDHEALHAYQVDLIKSGKGLTPI